MKAKELLDELLCSEVYEDFVKESDINQDMILNDLPFEEMIIKAYIGLRLKPLINKYDITENRYDNICEVFTQHYLEKDITIDFLINSLYNYINVNKHGPSDRLLTDDITVLLEDYSEE